MNFLRGKIARNASWIIISKLLQSALSFVVGLFTARYLGPSNYGLINYAISVVTFALPIVQLGFNNVLVHELTGSPEKEGKLLGTSIALSFLSAVFCMIGVISFVAVTNDGNKEMVWIVAIYSINLILQVFDLLQYWFQAKLMSKYCSITSLAAYIAVTSYKVFLLITGKNVYWFAMSYTIDYFLIAVMLLVIYRKLGGQKLAVDIKLGKQLFSKSRYYIVPGLMVAIFSQTDKIMLNNMLGQTATGYYSAAVTIATIPAFVYSAIIDSYRPIIFANQGNQEQLEQSLRQLYSIVIYISLAQSVVMTVFAELIVGILYGEEFHEAVNALRIVVWFVTFSYFGSVRNIWMLAKGQQKYLWIINASGAALNVVLNMLLIPASGIVGASIASLATQMFSNFALGFIIAPLRENNQILLSSLNPKHLLSLLKKN